MGCVSVRELVQVRVLMVGMGTWRRVEGRRLTIIVMGMGCTRGRWGRRGRRTRRMRMSHISQVRKHLGSGGLWWRSGRGGVSTSFFSAVATFILLSLYSTLRSLIVYALSFRPSPLFIPTLYSSLPFHYFYPPLLPRSSFFSSSADTHPHSFAGPLDDDLSLGPKDHFDDRPLDDEDDEDSPERNNPLAHYLHPVTHFVYDAAAERTQQRIREGHVSVLIVNGVH